MGTKNDPGEFDCYENAEPDEPMFVLLARDPLAPELVRRWAREYEDRKAETVQRLSDGWKPVARKAGEARKCADAMDEWRRARAEGSPLEAGEEIAQPNLQELAEAAGLDVKAYRNADDSVTCVVADPKVFPGPVFVTGDYFEACDFVTKYRRGHADG